MFPILLPARSDPMFDDDSREIIEARLCVAAGRPRAGCREVDCLRGRVCSAAPECQRWTFRDPPLPAQVFSEAEDTRAAVFAGVWKMPTFLIANRVFVWFEARVRQLLFRTGGVCGSLDSAALLAIISVQPKGGGGRVTL